MSQWYLNTLELSPTYGIYVTSAPDFNSSSDYDTSTAWHGTNVRIDNIIPKPSKVTLKGFCTSLTAARLLAKYDASNYNWNDDTEDLYLIEGLSRRWKIYSIEANIEYSFTTYNFELTLILSGIGSEGYSLTSTTGSSSSSPITLSSITNAGDCDAFYDSLSITGSYSSGNLTAPSIMHVESGYTLDVANEILDSASFIFYSDYIAKHQYIDALNSTTKFSRNKFSSTNVTFSTDRLAFSASAELIYKFDLLHPLANDPELILSVPNLTGTATLEVSSDNVTYWDVEKSLNLGTLTKYNLTKLSGSSEFYFKITTEAASSLEISYMKLTSYHNYTGRKPVPYIRANSTPESLSISFSAGSLAYDVRYRDKWST